MSVLDIGLRKKRKKMIERLKKLFIMYRFTDLVLGEVHFDDDHGTITIDLVLPPQREVMHLNVLLPNIQQEFNAHDCFIEFQDGKAIRLKLLTNKLPSKIHWNEKFLNPDTLKVELGKTTLDFLKGHCCHALIGACARMGKTKLVLYIMTNLYLQNIGKIHFYLTSPKLKDYYPFIGCENVHTADNKVDMIAMLNKITEEYKRRNKLLYSDKLLHATDCADIYSMYPHMKDQFYPIFLFIDEYARFSDDGEVQNLVTELVESASFVGVHCVICTQRPDATSVLKPRIRANLLCKIALRTDTKANSMLILDKSGAEKLPEIQGRAIVLSGKESIVQVPLVDLKKLYELLTPYRKVIENDSERCRDSQATQKIQSDVKRSNGWFSVFGCEEQSHSDQQSDETISIEW